MKKIHKFIIILIPLLLLFMIRDLVMPFIIAFILALSVRGIAKKITFVSGLSTRTSGVLCLIFVYISVVAILFFTVYVAMKQIKEILIDFPSYYSIILRPKIEGLIFNLDKQLGISVSDFLLSLEKDFTVKMVELSEKMLSLITEGLIRVPQILLSVFVCIVASLFICFDYDNLQNFFIAKLSLKQLNRLKKIKGILYKSCFKYIKSMFLIFLITFFQLFLGLCLLKVKNCFIIAAATAVADILPMIGVGIVLLPWSVISFVNGRAALGVGLFVLFLIITLVRNITEPKIIGKSVGIHPLLSLMASYIGMSVGGVWCAIILPILIVVIKNFLQNNGSLNQ